VYGLAAAVFSQNINRAITTAHKLKAGTCWVCPSLRVPCITQNLIYDHLSTFEQVNCINSFDVQVPFGGYKQSGIGRELGEYALAKYAIFLDRSSTVMG
jgi:aldehyde dehydrogenase (NAD+)